MKKYMLLTFMFINFNIVAYNQVIKGIILDKKTDSIICFASVYFDGTFVGTQSDRNGNFELDISKNSSLPLTISCMGYYSVNLVDFSTQKLLKVYLTPKTTGLKGVVISSKSLVRQRKKNMLVFKTIFLGTTSNARNCIILNENDITFNYFSDRDTLKAYTLKPIHILNKALGYKITYYLDKFEYYKKDSSFSYIGSLIFNEDLIHDEANRQLYERNRELTYPGSRMHFFRELWANNLAASGFTIKTSDKENIFIQNIPSIDHQDSTKYLIQKKKLQVYYDFNISNISFLKLKVYFDKNGYFDQLGIAWEGDMALKRIGDMLPYDYLFNIK